MIKKLFGYSMSTWLGALLVFILAPVASHIFPQQELGIINFYYSIVNIAFTFLQLGLDQAYLRFYSEYGTERIRRGVFGANTAATVMLVLFCTVVCFPFQGRISHWILGRESAAILPVLFFHLAGLAISRYYGILYRLQSSFWKYFVVSIGNTLLLKTAYIAGSIVSQTASSGLFASALMSGLLGGILLFADHDGLFARTNRELISCFGQEIKYGLPLMPALLIAILNNNIPLLFLRNILGFEHVAEYTVGVMLASAITLIHNGLNTFLEPYIFRNYKTERSLIAEILENFTRFSFFICLAVICVQDLFFLVFEKSYKNAVIYLPLLLASSLWYSIGDFYNIGIKIDKRTYMNIPVYAGGIVINVVLCVILIPHLGNLGAAVAASAASFVISLLKMLIGNRYYPVWKNKRLFIQGTLCLFAAFAINLILAESVMRYMLLAAVWLFSGAVLGVYGQLYRLAKNLLDKKE